jgi:hypothetical protein
MRSIELYTKEEIKALFAISDMTNWHTEPSFNEFGGTYDEWSDVIAEQLAEYYNKIVWYDDGTLYGERDGIRDALGTDFSKALFDALYSSGKFKTAEW